MGLRHGLVAVVLATTLAGCSDTGTPPDRADREPSLAPGDPSPPPSAACSVADFRAGRHVVLRKQEPRVFYTRPFSVRGGGSSAKSVDTVLKTYPPVDLGVRVDTPRGVTLDATSADVIVRTVRGASTLLDQVRGVSWDVVNRTGSRRHYVAYAGATVYRGTWRQRFCGRPVNDGTSVTVYRGTFSTVGKIHQGVVLCHREAPQTPRGTTGLRRVALRSACGPAPQSYRQFHEPLP